jgi:glycosyltransferase involved in cell wall biosynthesis
VPNALRESFFESVPATSGLHPKPKLLNIGVIGARKRQLALLQLAEELHCLGYLFELQFIGGAEARDPYVIAFLQLVKNAEVSGFAQYLGEQELPDLISLMDSASALVHVPSEESFGLVVAEAMARNLTVFGTEIGGICDIAAGVEGVELFPLADQSALKSSIIRWLDAGCPRPQTAAEAMRARYHPQVIAQRLVEIYSEVLATDHASSADLR